MALACCADQFTASAEPFIRTTISGLPAGRGDGLQHLLLDIREVDGGAIAAKKILERESASLPRFQPRERFLRMPPRHPPAWRRRPLADAARPRAVAS